MKTTVYNLFFWLFLGLFACTQHSYAGKDYNLQSIEVSLRLIGHEILLNSGDSVSRVLPILKEENQYRIQFESDFGFSPDHLVHITDSILVQTGIVNAYILEVQKCNTHEVVYSYQVESVGNSMIPCLGRVQPVDCYEFFVTISGIEPITSQFLSTGNENSSASSESAGFMDKDKIILLFSIFILLLILYSFKRRRQEDNPNKISIGDYLFDKRTMELSFHDEKVELTSKEADLLALLHSSANNTLEREVILKNVWGDDGDYVGRTLDVFISKLRKKLEADSSVKIVNVRGVGYKLILTD